ncbi:MAG: GrpB family protein [Myxococcota bacterium]
MAIRDGETVLAERPIEIVAYDPEWPRVFESERRRLAAALPGIALRIDHTGSTSVPGLAAKPVIDIQVSVANLHPVEPCAAPLSRLGYRHLAHPDDAFSVFFHRPDTWPHTHHVHVVEAGGLEEQRTLLFRDFLRENPAVARRYVALKRDLARRFDRERFEARQAYADAKGPFIREVLRRASATG